MNPAVVQLGPEDFSCHLLSPAMGSHINIPAYLFHSLCISCPFLGCFTLPGVGVSSFQTLQTQVQTEPSALFIPATVGLFETS